jgi:hypothetical protein
MSRVNVNLTKDIGAFYGASGSGKSYEIKRSIKKDKRVLIYDPEGEYQDENCVVIRSCVELVKFVKLKHLKNFRVAFEPKSRADFLVFCKIAFAECHADYPLTIVIDELGGVTSIAKAPPPWHTILTRARKYGAKICAGTQSPAEADKTLLRNRSSLWCGMLETPKDRRYISDETGIDIGVIEGVRGEPFYEAILQERGKPWVKMRKGKVILKQTDF